jgi:hypothetical protein
MKVDIKILEQELLKKQKNLRQKELLKINKKLPAILLQEVRTLKMAIKVLKRQSIQSEKRKYYD